MAPGRSRAPGVTHRRSGLGGLGPFVGEDILGHHDRFADQWHADVSRQVDEHLQKLRFGPALPQGEAQMEVELGMAARRRVGDDADERSRLEIETRPRTKGAEDGLRRDIDEVCEMGSAAYSAALRAKSVSPRYLRRIASPFL